MKTSSFDMPNGEPAPSVLRAFILLGHLMTATTLTVWLLMALFLGHPYGYTWQIILLTAFFGRAAAVGAGLSMDFSPLFLFYQAAITDFIIVLYVFPLFVTAYHRLVQGARIGGYLDNLHRTALSYKSQVAPYGILGLLIFVIFPFWSTGPLVGSIVGYLLGLPAVPTVIAVTAGNVLAIGAWVWFYDWLEEWNRGVALGLLALIFAIAIAGVLAAKLRQPKSPPGQSV